MRAVHRGQTSARHASWFPEQNCMGKNSRNNKIYVKQVASVVENCKWKSNYTKGKFKTFPTQILFNCGYSNDLPFPLDLYQKRYMCLIKIPGHAAALLSFGVTNSSCTANLASSFAHAQYVWPLCIACSVCLSEIAAILFINRETIRHGKFISGTNAILYAGERGRQWITCHYTITNHNVYDFSCWFPKEVWTFAIFRIEDNPNSM